MTGVARVEEVEDGLAAPHRPRHLMSLVLLNRTKIWGAFSCTGAWWRLERTDVTWPCTAVHYGLIVLTCGSRKMEFRHD